VNTVSLEMSIKVYRYFSHWNYLFLSHLYHSLVRMEWKPLAQDSKFVRLQVTMVLWLQKNIVIKGRDSSTLTNTLCGMTSQAPSTEQPLSISLPFHSTEVINGSTLYSTAQEITLLYLKYGQLGSGWISVTYNENVVYSEFFINFINFIYSVSSSRIRITKAILTEFTLLAGVQNSGLNGTVWDNTKATPSMDSLNGWYNCWTQLAFIEHWVKIRRWIPCILCQSNKCDGFEPFYDQQMLPQ
jgi:hypothetical protein